MDINKLILQHIKKLGLTEKQADKIFNQALKSLTIAVSKLNIDTGKPFLFKDYPQIKNEIDNIIYSAYRQLNIDVVNGIKTAWQLSNEKNNQFAADFTQKNTLTKELSAKYFNNNNKALEAFLKRKTKGLNLSDRVWNCTEQFKAEIEMAIDVGIRDGKSASEMASAMKQYLREPDRLFRRVRDEHGQLHLSRNAKAYSPGAGVYRSSYKNALRLTRTEVNMAYRTSDYLRNQQFDFVVGIEIRLSNNHTLNGVSFTDICDELKGKYPKTFKFTGWHPQCRCYSINITKTENEFTGDLINNTDTPSINEIRDVPDNFKKWIAGNAERIEKANIRGTLPYWIKDNPKFTGITVNENNVIDRTLRIKEAKKEYGKYNTAVWTKAYFDSISGGFNVYHKEHQFTKTAGGGEAEKTVGKMLANLGKRVEFLSENGKGKGVPDLAFDGYKWDIKTITKANENTIRTYIKDARKADNVIFYWDGSVNKLEELKSAVTRSIGYFKSKNTIGEMPKVFYTNQIGLLKQLY